MAVREGMNPRLGLPFLTLQYRGLFFVSDAPEPWLQDLCVPPRMEQLLPLKAQGFFQLVRNWVLLKQSWAGTGASLVLVRLEGEGAVQARCRLGFNPAPGKQSSPSGLGSQY